MLTGDLHTSSQEPAPVAYLHYEKKGALKHHSENLFELFPGFRGKDLIGLSATALRQLLIELEGASNKDIKRLGKTSRARRLRSSADGVFELTPGRYFVIEDLPLPDGEQMTVIHDVTAQERRRHMVKRLQSALTKLASQEAIYNGEKEEAFRLIARIAVEALAASRADLWLMNVDSTAIHQQEVCWEDGKAHRTAKQIEHHTCPAMFDCLKQGHDIVCPDITADARLDGLPAKSALDRQIKSVLLIPIKRGPRSIGGIFIAETKQHRHWREEEVSFVHYAADLIVRMLEAHDRQVAEEGLRNFNEVLDERVRHRTQELEEALETLRVAQDELVRSEKLASLGGLVAGVAHEINTPLGVALTSVTHLQDAVDQFGRIYESGKIKRSDLEEFFEVSKETALLVHRNLDRAAHLIRSFRMVAVDQAMEDKRTLMLGQYVGEIVDSLKPTLRKKGVLVTLDCKKDVQIKTVPGDLAHILTNLIMNAAQHAFKGRNAPASKLVRTSVRKRGGYIYIDVADNGIGIAPEIKDKVYEPFFTTARAEGGSGLGLNIVYNTVYQKLRGKIEIEENEGGGTLFKIRFPIDEHQQQKAV